jgi:murein tripeptide amidase MpaA
MEQRAKFLAKRYKAAAKKSSGATIEMAETIVLAVHELKGRALEVFYDAIGLDPESSTVRKLIIIGRSSPRLKRHLNRLPNAWTTLYELARLKSDQFETLVASGSLHPLATWDDLKAALGRGNKKDQEHQRISLPPDPLPRTEPGHPAALREGRTPSERDRRPHLGHAH